MLVLSLHILCPPQRISFPLFSVWNLSSDSPLTTSSNAHPGSHLPGWVHVCVSLFCGVTHVRPGITCPLLYVGSCLGPEAISDPCLPFPTTRHGCQRSTFDKKSVQLTIEGSIFSGPCSCSFCSRKLKCTFGVFFYTHSVISEVCCLPVWLTRVIGRCSGILWAWC